MSRHRTTLEYSGPSTSSTIVLYEGDDERLARVKYNNAAILSMSQAEADLDVVLYSRDTPEDVEVMIEEAEAHAHRLGYFLQGTEGWEKAINEKRSLARSGRWLVVKSALYS